MVPRRTSFQVAVNMLSIGAISGMRVRLSRQLVHLPASAPCLMILYEL